VVVCWLCIVFFCTLGWRHAFLTPRPRCLSSHRHRMTEQPSIFASKQQLGVFGASCLLIALCPKAGTFRHIWSRGRRNQVSREAFTSVREAPLLHGFPFFAEPPPGCSFHALGPVGLQSLELPQDLRDYLLEDELCGSACCDTQRLCELGFSSCVDHPAVAGHQYLEGYFHTLPCAAPVSSIHPRHGGDFLKPAASLRLRAFSETLRKANKEVLAHLAHECPEASVLRRLLLSGKAFADLAIQMHWGDAVGSGDIAWHIDAPNSALHMAVSIQGTRTLKMKVRGPFDLADEMHEEPLAPGSVYVGNPSAFEHGVEYSRATWENRVVAFQLRLLFCEAEMQDPEVRKGMDVLARGIAEQRWCIPRLEDVRNTCARLEKNLL